MIEVVITFSGNISMAVPSSCNQLVTRTYSLTSGGISHLMGPRNIYFYLKTTVDGCRHEKETKN